MNISAELILEAIKQADVVSDVSKLRSDIKLADQGVDSLGLFNVLLLLEEKFKIKISDDHIDKLETIDDILKYLTARSKD